jgi:molybdopterin-guanine dinucleotide biosynthesis protein A
MTVEVPPMIDPPLLYILAGGQSSRFGSDKARALLGGHALVRVVAECLGPVCRNTSVVAGRADQYADLGLRTIADRQPGRGPLAGLDAALADAPAGSWVLLASCDLAGATAGLVQPLLQLCDAPARAVAYRREHWEPLPALYHTDLRPLVTNRLAAGAASLQGLLDEAGAVAVLPGPDWPKVLQVNTPEDLRRLGAGGRGWDGV